MALRASRSFSVDQISPVPSVLAQLSCEGQRALRQLLYAVSSPIDANSLFAVIEVVSISLSRYGDSVQAPHPSLTETIDRFKQLAIESRRAHDIGTIRNALEFPMFRSYATFPTWGLLIEVSKPENEREVVISVGAELALCFLTGKKFNKSFASHLLNSLQGKESMGDGEVAVWQKKALKILREANFFFERGASGAPSSDIESDQTAYSLQLKQWFRACIEFARDKDHQCVLDHRTQSKHQLIESALSLRMRVEQGDDDAIQIMLAALAGIPVFLALNLPFLRPELVDWVLIIDLAEGCIKMSIELFAAHRATPNHIHEHALVQAGDIICSPMPQFLAEALNRKFDENLNARTLGDAIPKASARSYSMTTELSEHKKPGLAPSAARLMGTLGIFGVGIGLDPYLSALLVHNPRIVPTGKFYYAQASRSELHSTASVLYESLGWGAPVAITDGLPVGSRVTPKASTVSSWFAWMFEQVEKNRPARRYALKTLIDFHNAYAKFSASVCSFALALRDRKPIRLSAGNCIGQRNSIPVFDKPVGMIRGHRPVPLAPVIAAQIKFWFEHCEEMDKRIARLQIPVDHVCRKHLRKVLAGEQVPLFFSLTEKLGAHLLSTGDLVNWWPEEFGLEGNFGRHFWQTELRRAGVCSTDIDCYVRHSLRGNDPSSSTSSLVQRDWIARLSDVVDVRLICLGIGACTGLVAKG